MGNEHLTSFIGKLFGRFALYGQKDQKATTMEDSQMTEQEFEQLVERLRPRLMQMGREFFGSDTEAEEVVQETWLRAWGVRDRLTLTDAYILRIARNVCVSLWRGQRLQMNMTADVLADNVTSDAITPQEELEERENSEWLQSRLQRLPKAEREVWQLFYDEGLTVEEIAKARGTSVGTVRKTISNVRSTLRKDVRRHFINMRHLLIFILIALATGIGVAAIISPRGTMHGVIQKVFRLPEDTTIYDNVEVMATYHKDIEALYRHIASEIHYPESAMADSIQGRVIIRFVVEKDGRLTNFEVVRTPDDRLSNEAIRVLKLTEPWVPAKNKGQDVRCHFVMPIQFRLN